MYFCFLSTFSACHSCVSVLYVIINTANLENVDSRLREAVMMKMITVIQILLDHAGLTVDMNQELRLETRFCSFPLPSLQ